MRNREPGQVVAGIWYLGREESGVYFFQDGDDAVLISGGLSLLLPDIWRQAQDFGLDLHSLNKAVILHAHFDHIGVIPHLSRQNPRMEVFASARGREILQTPTAVATINAFSQLSVDFFNAREAMAGYDADWRDDVTVGVVKEGEEIAVGKYRLKVLEVPGHSSCSLALYEPTLRALFPSDAGGIPFGISCINSGNSNFTQYQEGLERLSRLNVDYYCADHCGYLTGGEAQSFGSIAVEAAKKMRAEMESKYLESLDVSSATKYVTDEFYRKYPSYFLDRAIMEGVIGQMVKHVAKNLPAPK